MKLIRPVYECKECGYIYESPIWEPKWLWKQAVKHSHPEYHQMATNPEYEHPMVKIWREWEQNRIIAIIEKISEAANCRIGDAPEHEDCNSYIEMPITKVVAAIKGENK